MSGSQLCNASIKFNGAYVTLHRAAKVVDFKVYTEFVKDYMGKKIVFIQTPSYFLKKNKKI